LADADLGDAAGGRDGTGESGWQGVVAAAVAGWQWDERFCIVTGIILSGEKSEIGAESSEFEVPNFIFFFFFFFFLRLIIDI
jgi:hypothetical protein